MSIGVSRELINLGKRNLEKPGIWEILKKKTRKTWNFEQKSLKKTCNFEQFKHVKL